MAIKGKTKSRSRRVVAVAPKPPVYVRKPPIWRRPMAWILIAVLVLGGTTVGIMIALNYMSVRHHRRFDLTESNVYSLSPQSANVVKGLTSELVVLNEHPLGYRDEMNKALVSQFDSGPWSAVKDRRGGIFLLRADNMSEKEIDRGLDRMKKFFAAL